MGPVGLGLSMVRTTDPSAYSVSRAIPVEFFRHFLILNPYRCCISATIASYFDCIEALEPSRRG
jgi:hypothetical protein